MSSAQEALSALQALIAQAATIQAQLDAWGRRDLPSQSWDNQVQLFMERSTLLPTMKSRLDEIGTTLIARNPVPPELDRDQLIYHTMVVIKAELIVIAMEHRNSNWFAALSPEQQAFYLSTSDGVYRLQPSRGHPRSKFEALHHQLDEARLRQALVAGDAK
ncbi:hypothetical protein LTR09_009026 [Extremus antarcticus]|uniref:Uncharacterized protein n=1 Tax=Extremus antarcticus TaxID=702011 RepID=A0AAJ0D9B0_9PEZI|nr:hypothetical protein LTR09_009026 [Extremus antarcticus]